MPLAVVAVIGRAAIDSLATTGVSLSACTSPSVGRPRFEIGDVKYGLASASMAPHKPLITAM
jgi:dihydroxyacetone kinase